MSSERETVSTQKRRGPKPTGKGVMVGVRIQPDQLEALDAWSAEQTPPVKGRPAAIRKLIDSALGR